MCGILGFNWEDEKKIKMLAELLQHRGPEQEGFHVRDGISIGHKRLKIHRNWFQNKKTTITVSSGTL